MSRSLALLLCLFTISPSGFAAEAVLESVEVEARVENGLPSTVAARYVFSTDGADSVYFSSVRFGGVSAANVRAFSGSRELSFHTEASSAHRLEGRVDLPSEGTTGRVQIRLDYEIDPPYNLEGREAAVTVPLLVPASPPREALPGTFRAEISVPGDRQVRADFPASFERTVPVDRTHDARAYSYELPVVPAFIRLRVGDDPPLWTLERAADVLTLAALIVLGFVGWRQVRERWS